MENLNTQMDDQLKNRVAELNRANDENRDGRLDAADLKAQLNRIEAQLELQDQQNRGIIANQRKRMVLSVVLCVIILAALAFFSWRMNEAYVNVMDACNRVNDLADTVQTSLDTLDQAQLDSMMRDLPEITGPVTGCSGRLPLIRPLRGQLSPRGKPFGLRPYGNTPTAASHPQCRFSRTSQTRSFPARAACRRYRRGCRHAQAGPAAGTSQ